MESETKWWEKVDAAGLDEQLYQYCKQTFLIYDDYELSVDQLYMDGLSL